MSDCLLTKLVDTALAHSDLDHYLYDALQAANDTMPNITRDHIAGLLVRMEADLEKLKEPLTEEQLLLLHPTFCENCEE